MKASADDAFPNEEPSAPNPAPVVLEPEIEPAHYVTRVSSCLCSRSKTEVATHRTNCPNELRKRGRLRYLVAATRLRAGPARVCLPHRILQGRRARLWTEKFFCLRV
jgi:hypothetical protein